MTDLPKRKPMRLRGYDYSQNGYYFITICTKDRKLLFGDIVDGKMILNEYGNVVNDEITGLHNHYDTVCVDKYVIMPNHIHMILTITALSVGAPLAAPESNINHTVGAASGAPTMGNIVRGLKSGISRKCGFNVWQRNYHDHIIRNHKEYENICNYIETNPLQWETDCHNENNKKYNDWGD